MKKDATEVLTEIRALCKEVIIDVALSKDEPTSHYGKNPLALIYRVEWLCRHALEDYDAPTYEQLMELPWVEFLSTIKSEVAKTGGYTRSWLQNKFTPFQIAHMYVKLHKALVMLTPDDRSEDPDADHLRDRMDVFWYATRKELIDELLDGI